MNRVPVMSLLVAYTCWHGFVVQIMHTNLKRWNRELVLLRHVCSAMPTWFYARRKCIAIHDFQ